MDNVSVPREWLESLVGEIAHGWGESFSESEIADQIRGYAKQGLEEEE